MAEDDIQERPSEQQNPDGTGFGEGDVDIPVFESPEVAGTTPPVTTESSDTEIPLPFPVVGIGASAGGVEAYIDLFQNLTEKTGMAFVLIPHLSAEQPSYLREIIARHTQMPTLTLENGMRPEPDHVYFLPPNARVTLERGAFRLERPSGDGARVRLIDLFFESLAAHQKNFAIGVVLSGMDSDGSLGLRAIKGEGGISIVQSPESARFPDMPRSSISGDHVDLVLPPAQIAQQLHHLANRFRKPELRQLEEGTPPPDEEKYLGRILKLLKGVSGVDFRLYKPTTIRRRIGRRMLMHRIDTLTDYAAILQSEAKELRELQEDILISVTRFFRDPEVFEALKQTVLPAIFEDRPPDQQVRIWVPGCSSGEEAYSIAICLIEFLTGRAVEPPIQIFGTDASEPNIQRARAGLYSEAIANEVSPERLRRFFSKTERGYQVSKRIRDLCIFARQNLCTDPPFSRLDLISCRNVLIYFGIELQKQLIPTFHYALRPDGFLLLGASETIRNFTNYFTLVDRKHKFYSKIGNNGGTALLEVAPRPIVVDPAIDTTTYRISGGWGDLELQRTADRIVLARYAPPGLIVNEQMEIIQSRGHTSPFLEMAPGSASLQLSRMVREGIAPQVTSAVKRALEQELPVQMQGLQVPDGDHVRNVMLEVLPIHSANSRSRCYLVLFVPSSTAPRIESDRFQTLPPELDEADKDRLVTQLQHDLSSTRLYLQSLLEERDAKNQELISANEEIQSANEELQSTNEELETTKEELQSSNEELQTVNDELQNRNAVLTQASNDLQNLLNSVNLPVLMLSNEFNIRHFTPQTQRLMNVRASDIGRPFSDIRLNLNLENLEPLFTEVLDTLGPQEMEVQDREGHWYLLRIRPYRTSENKIDGLVVALVDIDQLRRTQQGLRDARDFARSIIESIPLPLVVVNFELRIRSVNEAFCKLVDSTSRGLEGRSLPDLATARWGMEQPLSSMLQNLTDGSGAVKSFEFEHKTPDDPSKVLLVRARPLQPDGEPFLLITFEDVTAHKEVERLLKVEGERLAGEVASTTKELDRSREELRALTGSLLNSQEEERRRLARELHDDISQRLAALNMAGDQALNMLSTNAEDARRRLEAALQEIGRLSDDVRSLSHRLHPSIIEDLGLKAALRSLTQEFGEREEMITTFFSQDVPESLALDVATGLYRIAQEALRNVAKHAGKTHVKVQLTGVPGGLELQIADSGKGFDVEQNPSGLGLISMKERTRLIGATLRIQSALREGTRVTVNVPLNVLVEPAGY